MLGSHSGGTHGSLPGWLNSSSGGTHVTWQGHSSFHRGVSFSMFAPLRVFCPSLVLQALKALRAPVGSVPHHLMDLQACVRTFNDISFGGCALLSARGLVAGEPTSSDWRTIIQQRRAISLHTAELVHPLHAVSGPSAPRRVNRDTSEDPWHDWPRRLAPRKCSLLLPH